jgi:hypothetical protein
MKYKTFYKDKAKRRSKTQLSKGAFGKGTNKTIVDYKQNLKVIPKLKRTKENSNAVGVIK